MITQLRLKNFKSIRAEANVPLAPLTLIYGHNSAGKSSIIQALLLMKQSADNDMAFTPDGPDVDLGNYATLINSHDTTRNLYLGITTKKTSDKSVNLYYQWDNNIQGAKLDRVTINEQAAPADSAAALIKQELGTIAYFAPKRNPWDPKKHHALQDAVLTATSQSLQKLGWPYTLHQREGTGLTLQDTRNDLTLAPPNAGHGLTEILPILIAVATKTKTIIVEQPEIHLHPGAQSALADELINATNKNGQQILIETHSEALILRTQRRIREGQLNPKNVKILHADQNQDGQTTLRELRLNQQGHFIDHWPRGFFTEQFNEIFADFS